MPILYSEIMTPREEFQRSVNLAMDLGNLEFVERYIPTKASAVVLERYLRAILTPGADRASVLIGPYGKGKSHTLFIVLAMLYEEGERAEAAFEQLANKLEEINEDAADLVRAIRKEKLKLLPIIINDRYLDIRQAYLASLKNALQQAGLQSLMPDNYYQHCLSTIARWKSEFPSTYNAYTNYLREIGTTSSDYEASLKQFDASALTIFKDCHRTILSGAEFDPLLESDVPTLYANVNAALRGNSPYSGMFIVFDEFGKFLESSASVFEQPKFKVLQDLAELCCRSKDIPMLMTCISHKAISEYASRLTSDQQTSFRTIEGRFSAIYFTSTFEGSFSLIAGALGRNKVKYQAFMREYYSEYAHVVNESESLNCFTGYDSSVEEIVNQCFPMHPLTALTLMKLSEKAAQNERTLFTFLADGNSPLSAFIKNNCGVYELATVDMVYDYFHASIRESSYDPELRELVIYTDALIPTLTIDEQRLVKTITLFTLVVDNCLLAKTDVVCAALQWDESKLKRVVSALEQSHRVYTRRSDGVLCIMRSTTESVRKDIEFEVASLRNRIDIADQLAELRDAGYTIPRRYNDQHDIVRYFMNVFVSTEQFTKQPTTSFLADRGFADGYVIYLLGNMSVSDIQAKLEHWHGKNIVVLKPQIPFYGREAIEECAAISRLLEKATDEVAAEELSYYFDDMLQVVNRSFADMFESNPLCITLDKVIPCKALSSEVSRLCEEVLFPDTPSINHEMINRSSISGQMRQVRAKVIDALLKATNPQECFAKQSAEASVVRSVLTRIDDPKMQRVLRLIDEFLVSCEPAQQSLQVLFDKLLNSPYGLRRGVIPILFAYSLRGRLNQVTLYNHIQEQPLSGESLNSIDDVNANFYVHVDKGSADQQEYLQLLCKEFTPDATEINIREIYEAMRRIVRALPRCARANRKQLSIDDNGHAVTTPLLKHEIDLRQILVRQDNNARDAVVVKMPKAFSLSANALCAQSIISVINGRLRGYAKSVQNALGLIIKLQMNVPRNISIRGAMTTWLQRQANGKLNRAFESNTQALLQVMRNSDDHTDAEWINMIAIALTGLPIEDWSDQQAEDFPGLLEASLLAVEEAPESEELPDNSENRIQVSIGGRTISQGLPDVELSGMSTLVYDSIKATFDEFGESLSTDEKLLVLANLLVRLNDKE